MSVFPNRFDAARRSFLLKTGLGLGWLSAMELLGSPSWGAQQPSPQGAAASPLRAGQPHFTPRAKRVIYMHMLGAFSQVDTFDYKPVLAQMHGQEIPPSVRGNRRLSTMVAGQTSYPLVSSLSPFRQHGQCGAWISDSMSHIGGVADDLCFIKTVHTDHVNHDPASKFLHTGFHLAGRPSMGAWVSYALGSENDSLPTFIVLSSGTSAGASIDAAAWSAGFMPSHYQGVPFRSGRDPVPYVNAPAGVTAEDRRDMIDVIASLSHAQFDASHDPEILSKVAQYEMANRMQTSVPQVADISDEPRHVLEMYGPDVEQPGTFARNCLLARRLAERDVRFTMIVQLGWDHHQNIVQRHPALCRTVDQPTAALVTDLKQRGLLDDTLVVFASEFGRTSFAQGALKSTFGRDHHGGNFVIWMAGGGVKRGFSYGQSDDFSYNIVENPVSVYDLNATLLHLLGLDHRRLTYRFQGRDFRLTDVHGDVVTPVLA